MKAVQYYTILQYYSIAQTNYQQGLPLAVLYSRHSTSGTARHFPQMTVRVWLGRWTDQGGGGVGDGTVGERELRRLGTVGEPSA